MRSKRRKRSVRHDLPPWPGWKKIIELYKKSGDTRYPDECRLYFVVYFETGCRVSEGLLLSPNQFKWNEQAISVHNVPVLKRRKRETRSILIKIENNPLAHDLIDFIETCKMQTSRRGVEFTETHKDMLKHVLQLTSEIRSKEALKWKKKTK